MDRENFYLQLKGIDRRWKSCFSLQPGHHSSLTEPNLQPPANQERNDQCGNLHYSSDFEVRHRRCVGSITKNFVYYTYSRTQLYFTQQYSRYTTTCFGPICGLFSGCDSTYRAVIQDVWGVVLNFYMPLIILLYFL